MRWKQRWPWRTLVSLGRAARADAKLGVRQPLPRAIALLTAGEHLRDDVAQEIKDELNVKQLEVVDSLEGLLSYRVVPNFRALGPRLGKQVPHLKALLENVDGGEVRRAFDEYGSFTLEVDGEEVKLEPSDVEIRAEQHADLTLAQDGPHAVALDLTLDDDLRAEGIAREIIRVVNDRRKTSGFALADRVAVTLCSTGRIVDAAVRHADWIKAEVLATSFEAHEELLESAARRDDRRRTGLAGRAPRPDRDAGRRARRRGLQRRRRNTSRKVPAIGVLVEELVLAGRVVALVARTERLLVVHRVAQRREERVVVEDVGVDGPCSRDRSGAPFTALSHRGFVAPGLRR